MKKLWLIPAVILLCSSCAKSDPISKLPGLYSGDITCTATVQALSEPACEYTVGFSRSGGTDTIEVLAPESVAGVKATVEQGSAGISYEGKYLETLLPYYWGASPIDLLSALFDCMRDGSPVWWNADGKYISAEYQMSSDNAEIRYKISLDKDSLALQRAEAELDGILIMVAEVQSLQLFEP